MKKSASIFSFFCGVAMLATWAILLGTGGVPELKTTPFEVIFLLSVEGLTAVSLLIGGYGLTTGKPWGQQTDLCALGMLIYCTVYSTGVFGQAGNLPAAVFFAIIAGLAALFSARFILQSTVRGAL